MEYNMESFDIRQAVIDQIGSSWDVDGDGTNEKVISVTDSVNDTVYIPMGLPGKTRTGTMYELPLIEVTLVDSPSDIAGIHHTIHNECYFDFNIYFANTDNIDASTFGKTVADEIIQKIYDNYVSVATVYFVKVINSGRELFEDTGKSVIFHRVVECYGMNYEKD